MDENEKKDEDPVPKLKNKQLKQDNPSSSRKAHLIRILKPYIIAVSTAIIIGSVLGFIMLNMLTNINEFTDEGKQPVAASNEDNQDSQHVKTDEMSAYVLQVGVFSEKGNSEHWNKKFKENDFPVINWKLDGNYYLLAGIATKEQELEPLMDEVKENDFEAFKKTWTSPARKVDVSDEELEWLKLFQANWEASLEMLTDNESLIITPWEDLLHEYPDGGDSLEPLKEAIDKHMKDMENGKKKQRQKALLSLWLEYDNLLLTLKK